jgi:hypothetical protein
MHAYLQKQVAFNQRILKTEELVSGINVDLAEFLQGMSIKIPLVACVNVGARMRRTQPVCGELWVQENRHMAGTWLPLLSLRDPEDENPAPYSREEVALSGIVAVLSWRRALETSQDPNHLRPGRRIVVLPKFLGKLDVIIGSGQIGLDPVQSRWRAYEAILNQWTTWPEDSRPIMLPEGDPRLFYCSISIARASEWMEDAKRIAVAGYKQVLEDGPDVCDDVPAAEYSDHGEKWEDSDMNS